MNLEPALQQRIDSIISSDSVVLFMKGTPQMPQCGFSDRAVRLLKKNGVENFTTVNVLADADIREGIKVYSEWPTIPQLYIKGEFVGGSDIMMEMDASGELKNLLA